MQDRSPPTRQNLLATRGRTIQWVIFDRGSGLSRAALFRFVPETDVELEYCHLSHWANTCLARCGKKLVFSP
jgi:hypothetical protein